MKTKNQQKEQPSVLDLLNKLETRLKDFLTKQHYNICFFMKDDIEERNRAIDANNQIEYNFKSLKRKYYNYLENKHSGKSSSFEIITSDEFYAYGIALEQENNSLASISFDYLDLQYRSFNHFKNNALDEIAENNELHKEFMRLVRS